MSPRRQFPSVALPKLLLLFSLMILLPAKGTTKLTPTTLVKQLGGPHPFGLVVSSEVIIALSKKVKDDKSLLKVPLLGDVKPATNAIVTVNVLIFILWWISAVSGPPFEWMKRHFTLAYNQATRQQYPYSYFVHGFSHITPLHLMWNMGVLVLFGQVMETVMGVRQFVYLYNMAVYASGYSWVLGNQDNTEDMMIGASGAIAALKAYACLRFPNMKLRWFKIEAMPHNTPPKVSAVWALVYWLLLDISLLRKDTGVAHGAHLGGYLFGALCYVLYEVVIPKVCGATVAQVSSKPTPLPRVDLSPYHHASQIVEKKLAEKMARKFILCLAEDTSGPRAVEKQEQQVISEVHAGEGGQSKIHAVEELLEHHKSDLPIQCIRSSSPMLADIILPTASATSPPGGISIFYYCAMQILLPLSLALIWKILVWMVRQFT